MVAAIGHFERCTACLQQHMQSSEASALWVACQTVFAIDPHNVKCRLRRATAFERLHRDDEALADFQAVLDQDPAQVQATAGKNRVEARKQVQQQREEEEEAAAQKEKDDPQASMKKATELK